ncbi:S8 family peptidase [Limisphaera sp. VF-2]|jgi:hypothetical protein|uniref:S8 family peptidase n=1 Tax=Limisphaera sp. VF-2 TaxID=3400418 RepID=UPI00177612E9|nr:S8 family serine peptidase [Limisphaera sp.]
MAGRTKRRIFRRLVAGCACLWLSLVPMVFRVGAAVTNRLAWDTQQNRVDADVQGWSLDTVLREIAAQTGWRVFVEPGLSGRVSTRFQGLPPGEALRRLLDRLNFALLPRSNGPPQLYVFRTSLQEATQPVTEAGRAPAGTAETNRLRNEWIVRVKPGSEIEALARALGAEVVGRLEELHAYRLRFASAEAAEAARQRLLEDPAVTDVEANYAIGRPGEVQGLLGTSVGWPRIRARPPDPGGPVVVALLDTAVQSLPGSLGEFVLAPIRVVPGGQVPADVPTHGTAMAQTVLRGVEMVSGADLKVRLLPVDVYGDQPATSTFDLAVGVYRAVHEGGAHILNLSLGSEADNRFLHALLQQVSASGVLVLAAAGNEPVTTPVFPAAYPEVMAVTAGDRTGRIAPYANRGDFVDLIAPGVSVVYHQGQPFLVSGTSAATAFASGLAAGLAETRGRNPDEIRSALRVILSTPKP